MNEKAMKEGSFLQKIIRAIKFDSSLYEEFKADGRTFWQSVLVVVLASLANSIGYGIGRGFSWAGAWYLWIMLVGLIVSVILWLVLSLFVYFIWAKIFARQFRKASFRKLLNATGFSTATGLFGIFIFIPVIGGYVWLVVFVLTIISGVFAIRHSMGFGKARAIIAYLGSSVLCVLVLATVFGLALAPFVNGAFTQTSFDRSLNAQIKQVRFSYVGWEISALSSEIGQLFGGSNQGSDGVNTVIEYFSASERQNSLNKTVEKIIESQIKQVLQEQGVNIFPPVKFELGKLPNLLVVSPRNRIVSIREIFLDSNLTLQSIEDVETRVDSLNVSSLVVPIGGFAGVYPSAVTNDESLQSTISAAVEEWVHEYLAFKPLGFRYVLDLVGFSRNYDIAMINETAAGIVSDAIASILIEKYYPGYQVSTAAAPSEFSKEMVDIRQQVDELLARGEVDAAEEFMHEKQIYLQEQGYYIRKLNQAYLAWHSTYAYEPGFVSPIGQELMQLKAESSSLKDFLDTVSGMTSLQDLTNKINN